MNLVQVDFCKSVAYSPLSTDRYYWTSVYYMNADDFLTLGLLVGRAQFFEQARTTEDVTMERCHVKDPPGRGNIVFTTTTFFGQTGSIPSEGEYTLINIARWTFRSTTGRYSYRLNRMPLRPSDMDGQYLSDSGYALQESRLLSLLGTEQVYNSHGELLVDGSVDRKLHMWQLRDGTRRRQRNPLLP